MKRRNNIVTMLMDKVPRKNREGYAPKSSMGGHILLIELDSSGEIADFLGWHDVFSKIPGGDRRLMFDTLCENAVPHNQPGRRTTLLLKVRLFQNEAGGMFTPLAHLAHRFGRMYAILTDGVPNPKYDRGQSTSTMDVPTFIELAQDMPIVTCTCPDGMDATQFTYAANGIHVE